MARITINDGWTARPKSTDLRRPRWGLVGTGGISRTAVGDLHQTENLDLVAVASRTAENAEAFATAHDVPCWYGDYDTLFADESIDVVYIGTPIGTHADIASRALLAGKHVVVEKAFATNASEARALAGLAAQQRRFLMEAMWMRFNPAFQQMLDDVAAGVIGEVRTVQAQFGIPFPPFMNIWRPELGGGALLDMGVYTLTMAHLLLGKPRQVHATGEMRLDGLDVTASVHLGYDDGRFAQCLTSLTGFVNPVASVGGTSGFIAFDQPFMSSGTYRVETPMAAEPRTVTLKLEGRGYVPMFRAVNEAIADGLLEHPLRPLSSTIDVLDSIDEIRRQLVAQSAEDREAHTAVMTSGTDR